MEIICQSLKKQFKQLKCLDPNQCKTSADLCSLDEIYNFYKCCLSLLPSNILNQTIIATLPGSGWVGWVTEHYLEKIRAGVQSEKCFSVICVDG